MILYRQYDIDDGQAEGVNGNFVPSVSQGTICVCVCSLFIFILTDPCRILELTDTVKHLRSQNSEKDSSLGTMQLSLDKMVRLWDSWEVADRRVVQGAEPLVVWSLGLIESTTSFFRGLPSGECHSRLKCAAYLTLMVSCAGDKENRG